MGGGQGHRSDLLNEMNEVEIYKVAGGVLSYFLSLFLPLPYHLFLFLFPFLIYIFFKQQCIIIGHIFPQETPMIVDRPRELYVQGIALPSVEIRRVALCRACMICIVLTWHIRFENLEMRIMGKLRLQLLPSNLQYSKPSCSKQFPIVHELGMIVLKAS